MFDCLNCNFKKTIKRNLVVKKKKINPKALFISLSRQILKILELPQACKLFLFYFYDSLV